MKKLMLIICFSVYWILMALNIIINNGNIATLLLYIALYLPLTIAIIKEYDVFALFIIILYEIAECFMNLMGVASALVEFDESSIILVITQFITAFYAFTMLSSAIKFLRNRDNSLKLYVLVLGMLRCIFTVVNFIVAKEFSSEMILDMFSNIIFIIAISSYIIFFENKEIKIMVHDDEK